MIFVDTNYFIRFLLNDIPTQAQVVRNLFKKSSETKVKLFTSTVVIFEIYWLFLKYYEKGKEEIIEILSGIIHMSFVHLEEKNIFQDALEVYSKCSLELEDCYNIAYAKKSNMTEFASFDKKLQNYLKK